MDATRADALAARSHLARHGWIKPRSESFRHLMPPPAAVWLGEDAEAAPATALPADGGWILHPLSGASEQVVQARWLDAADPAERNALFAGLPAPGQGDAAPFAWAHRALVRQGMRLRIAPAADGATTWLRLERRPQAAVEAPLLVVELLPGARCVLLEAHRADDAIDTVQNLQVHVLLGAGAALQHLRVVRAGARDKLAHHVQASLQTRADYRQALLASGSAYHLQRNVLDLQGEGAAAHGGAVLLAAAAALEQQVQVRHAAPRTRAAVDTLALGSGAARLVANAHTTIEPGCDDAETRQRLAGIPTAGQPRIVLRPHLEIHHDQVQAAHGATWGALPEDALFHARQRGLDERTAQAMILEGLAHAVLARVLEGEELPPALGLDAVLADAVAAHLAGARGEQFHG